MRILETIRTDTSENNLSDKFTEPGAKTNYASLVIVFASTIEGLTPPALNSPSYELLRGELFNLLFTNEPPLDLTEAEIMAAMRLNADAAPPDRVEPYNALSRRYFSAVFSRFKAIRAAALKKVLTAPELRPAEPVKPEAARIPTTAALAQDLFETFKNVGEVHPSLIYPDIYDYVRARLRIVYPELGVIKDSDKQNWVFNFYTDLVNTGMELKTILHEPATQETPVSGA